MKPWLAAKTAGEALAIAEDNVPHRGIRHRNDDLSAAVIEWHEAQRVDKSKPWLAAKTAGEALLLAMPLIEWHEAQRERVGEYWKVRTLMHDYDYTDEQIARDTAYGSEPRAKLIHVTRYRRKR